MILPAVPVRLSAAADGRPEKKRKIHSTDETAAAKKKSTANTARADDAQAPIGTCDGTPQTRVGTAYVLDGQATAASNQVTQMHLTLNFQAQAKKMTQAMQMTEVSRATLADVKKGVEAAGGDIPKRTCIGSAATDGTIINMDMVAQSEVQVAHPAVSLERHAEKSKGEKLPRGVHKTSSGKFAAQISWGNKKRYIGTFGTPEQASAAYMALRKSLDGAKLSLGGADEIDAIFDAALKNVVEAVGGCIPRKQRPRATSNPTGVPTGVQETLSGEFEAIIRWGGKHWYVGSFDTLEKASAAYMSVERDLLHVKPSSRNPYIFDAARKKAVAELVCGFIPKRKYNGAGATGGTILNTAEMAQSEHTPPASARQAQADAEAKAKRLVAETERLNAEAKAWSEVKDRALAILEKMKVSADEDDMAAPASTPVSDG